MAIAFSAKAIKWIFEWFLFPATFKEESEI